MQRENRYIVIKEADAQSYLSGFKYRLLHAIADSVEIGRKTQGKEPLQCVVVESDWPEYEPTWRAIEARVDGKEDELGDFEELFDFYEVTTVKELVVEMKKHVEQLVARVHEKPFPFQRAPREG